MISTAMSQPRHHRRAADLIRRGYKVHVYGLGRGVYEENTFPDDVVLQRMGRLDSGRYLRRAWTLLRAMHSIRKAEAQLPPPALCYAFGPDSALLGLASKARDTPLVYEIGDLRLLEARGIQMRGAQTLERQIVKRAAVVILTSPSFEDYYERLHPGSGSKVVVAENRLPFIFGRMSRPQARAFARPLRIAFVGLLRYPRTLLPVIDAVAARAGEFEMHVFGDGPLREVIEQRAVRHSNVTYHGPFRNPDDLADIYSRIDLNYVIYDNADANVRLAIPNKLYESAFFGVPLVVAARTNLAVRVNSLRIGFEVEPSPGFAEAMLTDLRIEQLEGFSRAAHDIPTSELVTSEHWLDDVLGRAFSTHCRTPV